MNKADMSVELIDFMGSDLNVVNAARVSFDKVSTEFNNKDERLLAYLAKHGHWSPFAHTSITVRCKVPLFLARQLVKHQVGGSWNEVSRRYVDSDPEFWFPKVLHTRPENAKQGCGGVHPLSHTGLGFIEGTTREAFAMYKALLDSDVAPEEARMVLPLNTMTEFMWTGSVMFFARVIKQRKDAHAQLVAQEFAELLTAAIADVYPKSLEALLKD